MGDGDMTRARRAWLLNGRRHALRVLLDGRGRPAAGELVRKRDERVLARVRIGPTPCVRTALRRRLSREGAAELGELLRRVPRADGWNARRQPSDYSERVATLLCRLGIGDDVVAGRRTPLCPEPERLVLAGRDLYGRALWLTPAAANAWRRLGDAARAEGIAFAAVSGYRSADYQAALLARKLARGQSLADILRVSALPGRSEHHLGTTLDLHAGDGPVLEESFERTPAFAWLRANAGRFGFTLSYPRDNVHGIAYEPWHWRFRSSGS